VRRVKLACCCPAVCLLVSYAVPHLYCYCQEDRYFSLSYVSYSRRCTVKSVQSNSDGIC
jgi:hypothetical protein